MQKGLTNEDRHYMLLLYQQVHDKRSIAESLHVYINRARLGTCEVDVFLREYHNSQLKVFSYICRTIL